MQIKLVASFLFSSIFCGLATAAPTSIPFQGGTPIGAITAAQVLQFAPGTSSCTKSNPMCSTAEDAAAALNDACSLYGITTLGQKAGLIAYMAYESADFIYNINISPGRAGQGTKCMFMFPHIWNFAYSFPELKSQVLSLSPPEAQTAGVSYSNYQSLFPNPDTQNQIRALVLQTNYTFKCAAWYLTSYSAATCDKTVLNSGLDGFIQTMGSPCFYVDVTPDRTAEWCKVANALCPSGMGPPQGC